MTFFQRLGELIRGGVSDPPTSFSFAMIRPAAAGGAGGRPLTPDQCYLQVSIAAMRLHDQRFLHKVYHPVVHSFTGLTFAGKGRTDVPFVAGPSKLSELDTGSETLIISRNVVVLRPTPYLGGNVDLAIALCAAESKDYLANLLGILGDLSGVVGGSALSSGLAVVDPLKGAAEKLLGMGDTVQLKLGLIHSFESGAPVADGAHPNPSAVALLDGYYAFARIDASQNFAPWFVFEDGQLKVEYRDGQRRPVAEDHVVFRISRLDALDDWEGLPALDTAADEVKKIAARDGLGEAFQKAFARFKIAVIESDDLLEVDRVRIIEAVRADAARYADSPPVKTLDGGAPSALEEARALAPSLDDARGRSAASL